MKDMIKALTETVRGRVIVASEYRSPRLAASRT